MIHFYSFEISSEAPDPPGDVRIADISSRSIRVIWSHPFTGNSPISNYHIYIKGYHENSVYNMQMRNITVANGKTEKMISDLVPYTNYSICLTAVNEIGESKTTHVMRIQTDEEGKHCCCCFFLMNIMNNR